MADYFEWDDEFEGKESAPKYTHLPAGEYPCKILEYTKATSGKGNPMLKVTAEVDGGELGTAKVFWQSVLKDQVSNLLTSVGIISIGAKAKITWSELIGAECMCKIVDSERTASDGTPFNEVKYFFANDMEF